MVKVGEIVKWRCPLEEDYSYGTILKINKRVATIMGSGYYTGTITEVHLMYIEKIKRGGKKCGNSKKYRKR
jgi:hypothetical protein